MWLRVWGLGGLVLELNYRVWGSRRLGFRAQRAHSAKGWEVRLIGLEDIVSRLLFAVDVEAGISLGFLTIVMLKYTPETLF